MICYTTILPIDEGLSRIVPNTIITRPKKVDNLNLKKHAPIAASMFIKNV